jgi:hypothetical protein
LFEARKYECRTQIKKTGGKNEETDVKQTVGFKEGNGSGS